MAEQETALQLLRQGSVFGCVAAQTDAAEPANGPVVTPLGTMRYVCVATPVFAGHWFGDGFGTEAVQLAPAVVSDCGLMARFLAHSLDVHGPFPHHTMPVSAALSHCIERSLAYGLMPLALAEDALDAERLVNLSPGYHLDVALNWHAWKLETPFTRALSEQIVTTGRRHLLQT